MTHPRIRFDHHAPCERLASGIIHATEKVENFQTYFFQLVHGRHTHGVFLTIIIALLYVFSFIYAWLVNVKLAGYKVGFFKRKKLDCYVISLGNITVGGTG